MQKERLLGVKIGVVLTGSHCSMDEILPQIKRLKEEGAELYGIFSERVRDTDNRFYDVQELVDRITPLLDHPLITSIVEAE